MRRPIAEYYKLGERPDVVVGDDTGNVAEAAWSGDDGWLSLSDRAAPDVLGFEPTWFVVIPSREVEPAWLTIDTAPDGYEVLVTDGAATVAMASRERGRWHYSSGGRSCWEGSEERGGAAHLEFDPMGWKPKPLP